jgi:hypothetical protein
MNGRLRELQKKSSLQSLALEELSAPNGILGV